MKDRHRVLVAESGVEQREPQLAQRGFIGRLERFAQPLGRLGELRLEHVLLPRQGRRVGPGRVRVEHPLESLIGVDRPIRDERQRRPHAQSDREEDGQWNEGGQAHCHGELHLDRDDLLDHPRPYQLQPGGDEQHLVADRRREQDADIGVVGERQERE